MAVAAAVAGAVGLGVKTVGSIRQANAAQQDGEYNREAAFREAESIEQQGDQELATQTVLARRIKERADEILAQQRANAAAGGQSTTDGSVVAIREETLQNSSLDQLLAIAEGEEARSRAYHGAQVRRAGGEYDAFRGRRARTAGFIDAGSTLLSGAADWYDRFG